MLKRLERWFKLRFLIMYPLGALLLIFAVPDDKSLIRGIGFISAGLLLRVWANGYAIKMDKLTTSGPYAFIRHPLYLGSALVLTGVLVMLKVFYLVFLFLFLFMMVYRRTIRKEEMMLQEKFKEDYLDYKKNVPAFFPALRAYKKGEKWPFSFSRLIRSQEYKLFIWVIVLVIVFHLKDEFINEQEKLNVRIVSLIAAAFLLGCVDLVIEYIKKRLEVGAGKGKVS